jgi:large subunit ribosomal protein L19
MALKISPVDMESRKALDLRPGDTVRVFQKIEEKGKFRLQAFEGLVLARKHGKEAGATFTVRRVASGVGVEKVFPLFSPMIDHIDIVKRARVRRAKLYYIRDKVAREARRQLRRARLMGSSEDAVETEGVPANFKEETEAEKETIVEQVTAPTNEKETEAEKREEKAHKAE